MEVRLLMHCEGLGDLWQLIVKSNDGLRVINIELFYLVFWRFKISWGWLLLRHNWNCRRCGNFWAAVLVNNTLSMRGQLIVNEIQAGHGLEGVAFVECFRHKDLSWSNHFLNWWTLKHRRFVLWFWLDFCLFLNELLYDSLNVDLRFFLSFIKSSFWKDWLLRLSLLHRRLLWGCKFLHKNICDEYRLW